MYEHVVYIWDLMFLVHYPFKVTEYKSEQVIFK